MAAGAHLGIGLTGDPPSSAPRASRRDLGLGLGLETLPHLPSPPLEHAGGRLDRHILLFLTAPSFKRARKISVCSNNKTNNRHKRDLSQHRVLTHRHALQLDVFTVLSVKVTGQKKKQKKKSK